MRGQTTSAARVYSRNERGIAVSPGGHLVTTVAACAASAALFDSPAITLGLAVGGFLIDVDHAFDYVVFDRQRDLRPGAFLRYYLEGRVRRTVLLLHSYELFALLAALMWITDWPWLQGYLLGALMHLALDLTFNGEITPYSISAFYSFTYRAVHGFDATTLLGRSPRRAPAAFWAAFFQGSVTTDRQPASGSRPRPEAP
jgi:hypothetical protein